LLSLTEGTTSRYRKPLSMIPPIREAYLAGVLNLAQAIEMDGTPDEQHYTWSEFKEGRVKTRDDIRRAAKLAGKPRPPAEKVARMRFVLSGGATFKLERKAQLDIEDALLAAKDAVKLLEWAKAEGLSAAVAAKAISERVRKPKPGKAGGE